MDELGANVNKHRSFFKTLSGMSFTHSRARLHMKINELEGHMDVYVVRNSHFSYDLLLGLDAIKKFRLIQDENLKITQRIDQNRVETITESEERELLPVREEPEIHAEPNKYIYFNELDSHIEHLPEEKKPRIAAVLEKHKNVFAVDKFDVGTLKNCVAEIKLLEERYVAKKPCRCSIPDQREIESQITQLLANGLIEESNSPFASPVTLAYKKEDGRRSRLCVDFRDLNRIVVSEPQPFPRIEYIVVKAGHCHWYSTFDINSAFWSVPLRETDRERTAFVTQSGHFQWTCLPFGLKISPSIFQRILSGIIRKAQLSDFCVNYIDDILIFSETFEEHLHHVDRLMEVLAREGFKLKLSKCSLAKSAVKYLGHILEKNGIKPARDNLKAIREFPRPKSRKNVRQLLGKVNFYYKYLENACKQLEPLHNLLRKNVDFNWTGDCERAFTGLENYLCSSPILAVYDQNRLVFIYTDASGNGLGAVLKQPQENGFLHPVAYFSERLKPSEMKRKAIHLECLAIKQAIVYWQHWLIGRELTVISDHMPLQTLKVKARTDEFLGDLVYYLSQYNFTIKYASGKTNVEADSLSRNPVLESFEGEEDVLKVVNLLSIDEIRDDQLRNQDEIDYSKNVVKRKDVSFKRIRKRSRIFLSENMSEELLRRVHEYYGHIGSRHLSETLRPIYYFKNMDKKNRAAL